MPKIHKKNEGYHTTSPLHWKKAIGALIKEIFVKKKKNEKRKK